MSLSAADKAEVKKLWVKVEPLTDQIGAESFSRMLVSFPQTKTYFPDWGDLTPQNTTVRKHGGKIMRALNKAVKNIDNLKNILNELSELHANKLRVDPGNFKILAHSLIVVLAMYLPADFTPEAHLAVDKFMAVVAWRLSERYR